VVEYIQMFTTVVIITLSAPLSSWWLWRAARLFAVKWRALHFEDHRAAL